MLVDSAVWIDHLRSADRRLSALLLGGNVVCHPFVIGELACGTLKRRVEVIDLLRRLAQAPPVSTDDALLFVEHHGLMGKGLGWVDVHLLAAAMLSGHRLWTKDRRLAEAARRLGISHA